MALPRELVEHGFGRSLVAARVLRPALGVELHPGAVEADRIADGDGVQFREYLTKLRHRPQPSTHPAVGHKPDRLGPPLIEMPIDGVFQRGGGSCDCTQESRRRIRRRWRAAG
jgi:hypothetical protein